MPPKVIKLAELNQMAAGGADIMRQPREVVVNGLQGILERLSEHDDSVLVETLERLITIIGEKETTVNIDAVDFKPLVAMLEPRPYRFDIERNNRGQMTSVIAVPEKMID